MSPTEWAKLFVNGLGAVLSLAMVALGLSSAIVSRRPSQLRAPSKAVRNERHKLGAAFVNGLGISLIAVGAFSIVLGGARGSGMSIQDIAAVVICVLLGFGLHWVGRILLGGLEE